jgi:hypothetical protein
MTTQQPSISKYCYELRTIGDRSVGIVRLRTETTELFFCSVFHSSCKNRNVSSELREAKQCKSEVFTAVTMKNVVFGDVTPCGSCNNRRFQRTYRLCDQGDKNRRARNNVRSNWKPKQAPKKYVPPKRLFLQQPHGVTSQKTALFSGEATLKLNYNETTIWSNKTTCTLLYSAENDKIHTRGSPKLFLTSKERSLSTWMVKASHFSPGLRFRRGRQHVERHSSSIRGW